MGQQILRSEVQAALEKIKRYKAVGPDDIVTEMITSFEEYWVNKVTDIINEIHDTGEIPEDLCRSIFIALPRKPGPVECELHRTISLMSHIIKFILRNIMERAYSRIRPEIEIEQCGFVEDIGMRNTIFMVRMMSERAIEKQRCLYVLHWFYQCLWQGTTSWTSQDADEFRSLWKGHMSDPEPVLGPICLYKNRE